MPKCFQLQDEEQRAKDRALVHIDSHTKLLSILTIDPHTIRASECMLRTTRPRESIHRHWGSRPTMGPSLTHVITGCLEVFRGKTDRFVLLLQAGSGHQCRCSLQAGDARLHSPACPRVRILCGAWSAKVHPTFSVNVLENLLGHAQWRGYRHFSN